LPNGVVRELANVHGGFIKNDTHYPSVSFFPGCLAGQGFLSQDPTVWLDGARPANTCIPFSFPGNMPTHLHGLSTPESMFARI